MFSGLIDSKHLLKTILDPPVSAAHVRLAPTAYVGYVCMRAELYGWTVDTDSVPDWGKEVFLKVNMTRVHVHTCTCTYLVHV